MGMSETNALDLHHLIQEHVEIRRCYRGLEKVILRARSMRRILAAADNLVQMILLHFTHEEQYFVKLSLPGLRESHREANREIKSKLSDIEAELEQGKPANILQLLRLGKVWIKEHMHLENEEVECETLIKEEDRPFLVHRALAPATVAKKTENHDHQLPRLQNAHVREQNSPRAALHG